MKKMVLGVLCLLSLAFSQESYGGFLSRKLWGLSEVDKVAQAAEKVGLAAESVAQAAKEVAQKGQGGANGFRQACAKTVGIAGTALVVHGLLNYSGWKYRRADGPISGLVRSAVVAGGTLLLCYYGGPSLIYLGQCYFDSFKINSCQTCGTFAW